MAKKTLKAESTRLLNNFYQIDSEEIPIQRPRSAWKEDNKRGFFLGIIRKGKKKHKTRLYQLLKNNQFKDQQEFSSSVQLANAQHTRTFLDDMFHFYITPFHKNYNGSSYCNTEHEGSSASSKGNSMEDLDHASAPKHVDLKAAVMKRDVVCLFCWDRLQLEGAHIIAQKNIPIVQGEPSTLARANLVHKHQVENGLLLCKKCHGCFDDLMMYVDVVDDKLVVKVVNQTNDQTSEKHKDWEDTVEVLKRSREWRQKRWTDVDNRQALESNKEMALYFVINEGLPNREALKFHKTACLIWRLAGGAESEEEYCSDEDDGIRVPVDYRSKNIEDWMDSSATLIIGNEE